MYSIYRKISSYVDRNISKNYALNSNKESISKMYKYISTVKIKNKKYIFIKKKFNKIKKYYNKTKKNIPYGNDD
jgi:hypothetical protein